MHLEQRVARLERTCRALTFSLVAMTVVAACATLPPVRAAAEDYAAGWLLHRDGTATFGHETHLSGATLDVVGRTDSGLAIIRRQPTPADPASESFLVFDHTLPDGTTQKDTSFSSVWAQRPFPSYGDDPALLTRLFTTYQGTAPGHEPERTGLMQCGGFGTVFYPWNATNGAECPGANTTLFNGDIRGNGDLYLKGRLFVNGTEIR